MPTNRMIACKPLPCAWYCQISLSDPLRRPGHGRHRTATRQLSRAALRFDKKSSGCCIWGNVEEGSDAYDGSRRHSCHVPLCLPEISGPVKQLVKQFSTGSKIHFSSFEMPVLETKVDKSRLKQLPCVSTHGYQRILKPVLGRLASWVKLAN